MRSIRLLLAVVALLCTGLSFAASAQTASAEVYIRSIDMADAGSILDACYVIEDASIEGCDENADGLIEFQDVRAGTFTVVQTQGADGYLPVGDFPITVASDGGPQYVTVKHWPSSDDSPETIDIAVAPVDAFTNEPLIDTCFLLNGGSIEGCDENGNGQVTFEDVAVGTYLLSQSRAPDGYKVLPDTWVAVASGLPTEIRVEQVRSNADQDEGALTITTLSCPSATCTEPAAGIEFFIGTPNTDNVKFATTDDEGEVIFPLAPFDLGPDGSEVSAGEILLSNPYGKVAGYQVECTKDDGTVLDFDYTEGDVAPGGPTYGVRFTDFDPDDRIACTWYNVPVSTGESASSDGSESTDDLATVRGAVWQCPSTDADLTTCEPLSGVTVAVAVNGEAMQHGPYTTEPIPDAIGFEFKAPADADVWAVVQSGLPEDLVMSDGDDPLSVNVADLPVEACGLSAPGVQCAQLNLIAVPTDVADG